MGCCSERSNLMEMCQVVEFEHEYALCTLSSAKIVCGKLKSAQLWITRGTLARD